MTDRTNGDGLLKAARSRIEAMKIAPCSGIASSRAAAEEMERALNHLVNERDEWKSRCVQGDDLRREMQSDNEGLQAIVEAAPPKPAPDREALIHTICPHIRQYSDSHWQGNHACLQCPATVKISQGDAVQRCRRDAEGAADDVIRCWQSTGAQILDRADTALEPKAAG